ncbi:MAG TPA: WbqC family protein [Methylomirabilota bacterium]
MLGYFDQLYKSNVFVHVQYDKHGWRNRNRIKTAKGPLWLSVPVLTHGQDLPTNRDARIDTRQSWARKHLQALRVNYAKAPAFSVVFDALEPALRRPWTHLVDVNRAVLETLCRLLGLERPILLSSELDIPGQKTERLIAICRSLGADRYLTGDAASDWRATTLTRRNSPPMASVSSIITTGIPSTHSSTGSSCRTCPWWTCS